MADLYEFRKGKSKPIIKTPESEDKHVAMMEAIAPFAKNKVQSNVTNIDIIPATKNSKIFFILLPEWSPNFPPFNVARLAAVAKKAGYATKCLDLNVKIHNVFRKIIAEGRIDFDPWDGAKEWKWLKQTYYTELHPHIEPILKKYIEEIVEWKPDVVGFTMYYCNEEPIRWVITELKKLLPDIKIMVGGPNAVLRIHQFKYEYPKGFIDYLVVGEGELILMEVLNEIENGVKHDEVQVLAQPEQQRLNLNNLPLPDYTDFDFNEYVFPNGINTEFSRGCVAKCTFCEETHFWKYRQRMATDALAEIEHLYYTKGTDVVWFIDSLVNGNLNELRAFCKAIIAKEIKIHWTGYCRCDGRMDLEFYKDLKASGCEALNYGIESGSEKVLNGMAKGVTIPEMEQNLRDGKEVGISAFTNWIVGFPTEEYKDFADTLTFIWRNRNQNLLTISAGFGFGMGMNTVVGQNPEKFGIAPHFFLDQWMTTDYRLTKMHVLCRVKSFAIFLQNLVTTNRVSVPHRPNLIKYHYKLNFFKPEILNEIDYETFDYSIIKAGISPFADTLVNEMFVLFRILWRTRGGYSLEVKFDEELDLVEFGDRNVGPYWSNHKFIIDADGNWKYRCDFKFKQPKCDDLSKQWPFKTVDFSHNKMNAAKRARVYAKPAWGENGRSSEEFQQLMAEERRLNTEVDLSFEYEWEGSGYWGTETSIPIDFDYKPIEITKVIIEEIKINEIEEFQPIEEIKINEVVEIPKPMNTTKRKLI